MPDENTPLLLIFAAYFAIAIGTARGVYWLFSTAGENLKEDKRSKISQWLLNEEGSKKLSNLPSAFADLFDSIFTEKHLSWRCFRRSVLASLISVAVLATTFGLILSASGISIRIDLPGSPNAAFAFLPIFVVLTGNVVADYISLMETRAILSVMRRGASIVRIGGLLVLDIVLSTIIYVILGWGFYANFVRPMGHSAFVNVPDLVGSFGWLLGFIVGLTEQDDLLGNAVGWWVRILFYSTFFTSAWLWLFAVSSGLVRINKMWAFGRGKIASWFDVEERPLRSLGTVAAMLTVVVFVVAWPFLT